MSSVESPQPIFVSSPEIVSIRKGGVYLVGFKGNYADTMAFIHNVLKEEPVLNPDVKKIKEDQIYERELADWLHMYNTAVYLGDEPEDGKVKYMNSPDGRTLRVWTTSINDPFPTLLAAYRLADKDPTAGKPTDVISTLRGH